MRADLLTTLATWALVAFPLLLVLGLALFV
jgi:hypothetical protein